MNNKKTILVTGAAGFIGFHVAKKLIERGDKVVLIDNFNSYYLPALKQMRASILKKMDSEVLVVDICNRPELKKLFNEHCFTHVLHLAAQAGVRYARENPDAYLKSNLEGFLSILECCKEAPHTKVTFASSSSVYGCNKKTPFSIEDRTDQPANLYAATKKANELMAYSYHHLYSIPMTALRYFTVYGPWGRPDMAYFLFTNSILKGEPIQLFNLGKMSRDFTYIDDVVWATIQALDYNSNFEVFNIGNNNPSPLLTLVETLEELLGKKAILRLENASPGEVETTFADIEYTKQKLGFTPQTSLKKGLTKFVEWHRATF